MPEISQRGSTMVQSPIRSLVPYARQAAEEGVHVYHLNIGQPDIETPRAALNSLKDYNHSIIKYGASEGNLDLRKIAQEYYQDHVADIQLEDIFVTTGASEAISFTLFNCLDPGSEIIIPEPFYANYIGFAHVSDAQLVPITCDISIGFGLPDIDQISAKITRDTKAIFLCNPSNPTGSLYSKDDLIQIGIIVKKHDLYLIVDEVYREFCYEETFYSVLRLEGLEDHVIVIDSISKVFSACGSRVGYIVSRNQKLMQTILKTAQLRLCPPNVGQHIAMSCYIDRHRYLEVVRDEYRVRRDYCYDRLSKMDGVKCYLPKAAFYIMAELPIEDSEQFCKWLLSNFRKDNATLMLAPGHGFYKSKNKGQRQVRIAFMLGVEHLEKCMDILEKALFVYKKHEVHHMEL